MKNLKWWFDYKNPSQVVLFGVLLVVLSYVFVFTTAEENTTDPLDVVSIRKPIVMLGVQPERNEIQLGEKYAATFFFEKTRYDCTDGNVIRNMYNVETGDNYVTEIRRAVNIPKPLPDEPDPKEKKFRANMNTVPLREEDDILMKPGVWKIASIISYTCPTPSGGEVIRDEAYSTPTFIVHGPAE